eukprot:6314898-Amphidinium_carterae.1
MNYQPNHFAVSIVLAGNWVPQTFLKRVKASPSEEEHPSPRWSDQWAEVSQEWDAALLAGDVDAAWSCWNGAAMAALGFNPDDRGPFVVRWSTSPKLKSDPDVIRGLERRFDLEQTWYQVQTDSLPLMHWPSAAGPYVATLEGQHKPLEAS